MDFIYKFLFSQVILLSFVFSDPISTTSSTPISYVNLYPWYVFSTDHVKRCVASYVARNLLQFRSEFTNVFGSIESTDPLRHFDPSVLRMHRPHFDLSRGVYSSRPVLRDRLLPPQDFVTASTSTTVPSVLSTERVPISSTERGPKMSVYGKKKKKKSKSKTTATYTPFVQRSTGLVSTTRCRYCGSLNVIRSDSRVYDEVLQVKACMLKQYIDGDVLDANIRAMRQQQVSAVRYENNLNRDLLPSATESFRSDSIGSTTVRPAAFLHNHQGFGMFALNSAENRPINSGEFCLVHQEDLNYVNLLLASWYSSGLLVPTELNLAAQFHRRWPGVTGLGPTLTSMNLRLDGLGISYTFPPPPVITRNSSLAGHVPSQCSSFQMDGSLGVGQASGSGAGVGQSSTAVPFDEIDKKRDVLVFSSNELYEGVKVLLPKAESKVDSDDDVMVVEPYIANPIDLTDEGAVYFPTVINLVDETPSDSPVEEDVKPYRHDELFVDDDSLLRVQRSVDSDLADFSAVADNVPGYVVFCLC